MDSRPNVALSLNRKMPASQIPASVAGIMALVDDEDEQDEIAQKIDQPLEVLLDSGVPFLKCEYNRDGDSWRSPISNTYFPPLEADVEDAFYPTGNL